MAKLEFRTLRADEIECRIGTVTQKGVSLLMYKNARIDMALLDEVVGVDRWKRTHEVINGNLYCTVAINFEGNWVEKQDVGVESYTEKEKGQASDAFKRACVNWGIGRELYTSPFVWINLNQNEWVSRNGKNVPNVRFYVSDIQYDDNRRVSFLEVRDQRQAIRYTYGTKVQQNQPTEVVQAEPQPQVAPVSKEEKLTVDEERIKNVSNEILQAKNRPEIIAIFNKNKDIQLAIIPTCQERMKQLNEEQNGKVA